MDNKNVSNQNQNQNNDLPLAGQTDLNQPVTDQPPAGYQSPPGKEQAEAPARPEPEKVPIRVIKETQPSKEVENWMKKLEKGEDINLPQPVTDDFGQTLVQPAVTQKPNIILPMTEEEINIGVTKKIVNSIRWMAEWCLRLFKKDSQRVEYKK